MAKPWMCRLGMHRWEPAWTDTGQKYRHCKRCGGDDTQGFLPNVGPNP
jgi:hypothetical protein